MSDVCQEGCLGGGKHYVGDIGTEIIVDVCSDLTTAVTVSLAVMKPGATVPVTWVGSVYELTKIRYIALSGDFSLPGEYKVQALVTFPSGTWRGSVARFRVYAAFEA